MQKPIPTPQWVKNPKKGAHFYELVGFNDIYINRDPIDSEWYLFYKGEFVSSSYDLDTVKQKGEALYKINHETI